MAGQPPLPNWATVNNASNQLNNASNQLNQGLQTITGELSFLQNVPVINVGIALQNLTQVVTNGFQHLNDRMDVIEITLDEIEERAADREERGIVRARNAGLKHHETIEPILVNGQVPDGFPPTVGDLAALNGNTTNFFLTFYGLPVNGNLRQRRQRLARFLGVFLG
ncbi:hypothetical protein L7F22_015638 [Adiantum nelumboides]|nr:hypothetical protein [Adiantum nelumboides]